MQAWYTTKSPPLLKQTWKQASAGSFAKFCSRQPVIFVQHGGQKLLAIIVCGPCSRSLEQLQAARERVENLETDIRKKLEAVDDECQGSSVSATCTANRPVAVANCPVAVQSLLLTVLSLSSRCRFHVAVTLSLNRFHSTMNGNRSQRLSDFGHI